MKKFLLLFSPFVVALSFCFFCESKLETHSIFYVSGENVYENLMQDSSFDFVPAFWLLEHVPALKSKIQTGEYKLKKGENIISLMSKMLSGKRIIRKLTIPEGYTVKRIIEVVNNNKLLFGEITGEYPEASLAPNTYFYSFGDTKNLILQKMKNQMNVIRGKYAKQNETKYTLDEIFILASIIEKESGNKNEVALISSVFHNRLAIKMRLQSDPTVIYAITDGYGIMTRALTRKDLWYQSPYNTYRNAGFPPTPICCPGEAAIQAALFPDKTDFLYFVACKDGASHVFSKKYEDHLKAVRQEKMKQQNA